MDAVEVKEVIITTLSRRGDGVKDDPVRVITQIWDRNGELIAEIDPVMKCKFDEWCKTPKPNS